MSEVTIYKSEQFGDIRTAGTAENPLFCLADVCRVLELEQVSRVKGRLNEGGVTLIKVGVQTGIKKDGTPSIQEMDMTFINEQNLYKVIMRSDKPQAEPFQDWVCGEVLPSIRKNGAYMTTATIEKVMNDPDSWIKMLQALKESNEKAAHEREQRLAAEGRVGELEAKEVENKPKVVFADAVAGSDNSCLIGELAKMIAQNGYPIGEKRLFEWMRDNHYLCSYGEDYNTPYQRYIEMGLFTLKQNIFSVNGVVKTRKTPKVTGKGQIYFINKFLGNL